MLKYVSCAGSLQFWSGGQRRRLSYFTVRAGSVSESGADGVAALESLLRHGHSCAANRGENHSQMWPEWFCQARSCGASLPTVLLLQLQPFRETHPPREPGATFNTAPITSYFCHVRVGHYTLLLAFLFAFHVLYYFSSSLSAGLLLLISVFTPFESFNSSYLLAISLSPHLFYLLSEAVFQDWLHLQEFFICSINFPSSLCPGPSRAGGNSRH